MSRTFRRTITGTADALTAIALAQQTAGAADLLINGAAASGGVATLPLAAQVAITVAAVDFSGVTFTVYGTDRMGSPISEARAGPNNNTVKTTKQFLTVTRISASAVLGTNITVGYSAPFYSAWMPLNQWRSPFNAGLRTTISGTVNYDLEATNQMVMRTGEIVTDSYVFDATNFSAKAAASFGSLQYQVQAIRIKLNSGTGTVNLDVAQAGE